MFLEHLVGHPVKRAHVFAKVNQQPLRLAMIERGFKTFSAVHFFS
jgi:hypothetical protein